MICICVYGYGLLSLTGNDEISDPTMAHISLNVTSKNITHVIEYTNIQRTTLDTTKCNYTQVS